MAVEREIEKRRGQGLPVEKTQSRCRAYAAEQIERQKKDFQRLSVLGDWDHPFTTMAYKSEADEIRTLAKVLAKGYIYRGLKPVNWCFDCGSALAEAEVEYMDRADFAVDEGLPFAEGPQLANAVGREKLPAQKGWIVIWTTTPGTPPATTPPNAHPATPPDPA